MQEVGAKHIIFTLGYLNRFKHPKPIIEKRYEDSGAWLYHSDYSGALLIDLTRKTNVQIRAWRQAQQLYWHDNYHLSEN